MFGDDEGWDLIFEIFGFSIVVSQNTSQSFGIKSIKRVKLNNGLLTNENDETVIVYYQTIGDF